MGVRKWWMWNNEYEEEQEQEQRRCDSQFSNIICDGLFAAGEDEFPHEVEEEEEDEGQREDSIRGEAADNETPYFTPSPSSLSFTTCPSSLDSDTGEWEHQFSCNDSNDEDENGVPYCYEYSVTPQSQECVEENSMEHHVTRIENENENLDKERDVESGTSKGQEKAEEQTLDIDIFNNTLIFKPPEAEEEYQNEEGEEEEEGLPRSSEDLLSFSSSSDSTKDNEKETGMVSEGHRKRDFIKAVVAGHFRFLVEKLVAAENVNAERWKDIICSLSWEATSLIKLDALKEGKAMDPRGYVKVKCIACGHHTQSELIKGVVFKKTVAHKHMPTRYKNPRLLLLGGALDYEGHANQLSSFDNLLRQGNDFLQMSLGKIEAHRPNVVLVEKSVSRPAQEFLLAKEISLVSDVNKSRLEYIAQCTGAKIISSLNNLTLTNLKHCELFHVEKFVEEHGSAGDAGKKLTKNLMFFEGCPKPLGCTILLKGASGDELKKVKRVVQHAVFAANHLALETSFLADERARFLETLSHSAAIVGKPSGQMSSETSIYTIHGFTVPVLDKAHAGEEKEQNEEQCLTISPLLSRDSLNNIEGDSKPIISTGSFKTKECVSMPSCRDVCPTNEVMHEKYRNAAYHGFMLSPVSSSALVSGLSASLKWAFGEAFPLTDRSSYAASTSYLGMKDTESNDCTVGDVSTFSVTSGTDDCRKISEKALSKVQSKNEGITDIQDDFSSLESQPKIESKNKDSTPYEEEGFSKEGLTTSLSEHQSILVLFSSHCILKGIVCERNHASRINYYGSFDKPLGRFLKDRLLHQSSRCHACEQPPTAHAYFYTHQQGRLTISVQQLHSDFILPSVGEGKIWMWHRCLRCEWKDGIPQGNRRVVMSDAASVLSFGKFLELSFLNHTEAHIASCGHSLQRDCLQFYGLGNMVACFHYSPISVFGVWLPSKIMFNHSNQQEWLRKEVEEVAEEGSKFFSEILHLIHEIKCNVTSGLRNLSKIEGMLQKEKEEFEESLQKAITKNWQPVQPAADILELNCLRRKLLFESYVWECRFCQLFSSVEIERSFVSSVCNLQDLDSSVEKQNRSLEKIGSHIANNHDGSVSGFRISYVHGDDHVVNSECTGIEETKLGREKVIADEVVWSLNIPCSLQDVNLVDQLTEIPREYDKSVDMVDGKEPIRNFNIPEQEMTSQAASNQCFVADKISGNQSLGLEGRKDDLSLLESNLEAHRPPSERNSCDVSDLSDTFDAAWTGDHIFASQALNKTLNSEGVSEQPFENLVQQSLIQSIVKIESGDSCLNMQDKDVLEPSSSTPSLPVKPVDEVKDFKNLIWHPFSCLNVALSRASQEFLYKLISEYTPVLVNSAFKLLNQGGARLLLPAGIDNIVIPVYDDEPTSLIAYALSSKQYWAQISDNPLEEKQRDKHEDIQKEIVDSIGTDRVISRLLQHVDLSSEVSEFAPEGRSNSSENASTSGSHGTADSQPLLHTKVTHAEISFSNVNQLEKVKYSVICFHAKNFSALRKICNLTEREFICSLNRCKKWEAQGGKSKVFFAKTLDDRFIIKQLSKTEFESFLQFAPAYFQHLTYCLSTGSPTCLAKILGVYQVSIKQSKGGKDGKMDLMVMENLLLGRSVTRLYDLKGSLRNRHNPESSRVLLDQNFIEAMLSSPIFVGNKAKHDLERAVWNDTSFLNSINVMDYSLLVGVDEEQQELVLGIIDFVRQYTWDKHLETWVKASGILGGPKNESPTVISPKEYKKRFRKAISTYFQTVPDP